MEFGRVTGEDYKTIDFRLQDDPVFNKAALKGAPVESPKVFVGCPKWGYNDWPGRFFPNHTSENKFLDHYVKLFNCVELNATHYRIFEDRSIDRWSDKAYGHDFMFCPKMFQGITHKGSLTNKQPELDEFLKSISFFKPHLGPVFIQLSESFQPKRKPELFQFLESLPVSEFQFFFEIRHVDWFSDKAILEELFSTLRALNIGAVITDTAGRRDCAHMYLPIPATFIRFVCNEYETTDRNRIDLWVKRIKSWLDNGLQEIYFIVHLHDEKDYPEFMIDLIQKLNKECGLDIKVPVLMEKQKGLFD